MQFLMTGLTQEMGFHVLAFEGMGEGQMDGPSGSGSHSKIWHSRLLELPLMCRVTAGAA